MAAPTAEELQSFGELIRPFQRNLRGKTIEKDLRPAHKENTLESGIGDKMHDATNNGEPEHPPKVAYVSTRTIQRIVKSQLDKPQKKKWCYLWVLDQNGIRILWEGVENPLDIVDGEVKHTNITGGGLAFHGGELFITSNKEIFVNNKSDRYGNSAPDHWGAVITYFKKVYQAFTINDLEK